MAFIWMFKPWHGTQIIMVLQKIIILKRQRGGCWSGLIPIELDFNSAISNCRRLHITNRNDSASTTTPREWLFQDHGTSRWIEPQVLSLRGDPSCCTEWPTRKSRMLKSSDAGQTMGIVGAQIAGPRPTRLDDNSEGQCFTRIWLQIET